MKTILHALGVLLLLAVALRAGEIHDAAAAGDLNKVKTLLTADPALLEAVDDQGLTPLLSTCSPHPPSSTGQVAVARFLLEKGANINARGRYDITPLRKASGNWETDVELIRLLIEKGADVNARSESGLTALHLVAAVGNLQAAQLLLGKGADVNARDRVGYGSVLQMAINNGRGEELPKLLVERGAKPDQKSTYGNTELHLAAMKGYAELAPVLIKHGADVNATNDYGRTAVYYAAKLGHRRLADALIAAGARKGDIAESNFGKAPQLSAPLKDGEAYLWYLGGLYGQAYAVKTKNHLLIFDKTGTDGSPEAGLANGRLNPAELTGQKIAVFVTKAYGLMFDPDKFGLMKLPGVQLILDSRPTNGLENVEIPPYRLAGLHENFSVGDVQVRTVEATARGNGGAVGMGCLVEVDGLKIFHSGFHAAQNSGSQKEKYRKEVDFLKPFGPIDIAMLTVNGHLSCSYRSYHYLMEQLSPKAIYLMGGDGATDEYPKCVRTLQTTNNIPVAYPEGGRALGERFHFVRDQLGKPSAPGTNAVSTTGNTGMLLPQKTNAPGL